MSSGTSGGGHSSKAGKETGRRLGSRDGGGERLGSRDGGGERLEPSGSSSGGDVSNSSCSFCAHRPAQASCS